MLDRALYTPLLLLQLKMCAKSSLWIRFNKFVKSHLKPQAYDFIKEGILAQVFSCEFCEIF